MPDPYVSPWAGPFTMGAGTMGLELGGQAQTLGRDIDYGINPTQPDGPGGGGGGATIILPEWRLAIYWDGDDQPATDYLDRPHASLPSAELRVAAWGELVQTAKGVVAFDSYTFVMVNVPDAAGDRFSDAWSVSDPPEGKLVRLYLRVDAAWEVQFTGRIVEIPEADERFVKVIAGSVAEAFDVDILKPITTTEWPAAPAASLKRHQPLVFGTVPQVEGVLVEDNLAAVLASSLTSTATAVELEEDPGLPSSGTVLIDAERITYTGINPGTPATLTGVVRGADGTLATDHPAGSLVHEVGSMTWLFSRHASTLTNPRLVDSDGNVRNIPAGVGVTIDAGPPATIQLDQQPVLSSLGAEGSRAFRFVDLDTADMGQTDNGFTEAEVNRILARTDEYTETNTLDLSATDGSRQYATGRRVADLEGIPDGATLVRAYAVVEHYLPAGAADIETALNGALAAGDTGDILVDDVAAFPSSGTLYIGEERVTYTGTTTIPSARFTGVVRGANDAGALDHPDGAKVVQSALEVRVRTTPGATGLTDGEGFAELKPTAPEVVQQDLGLAAVSKGFEDAHTHEVSGTHDHATNTEHVHDAPTILEWQPSLVQGRSPKAPTAPCTGQPPAWEGVDNLLTDQWGQAVDNNLSTSVDLAYDPLQGGSVFYGWYYIRSTSADLSPSDTRQVKTIEVSIATSKRAVGVAGTTTTTWSFNSGLGICQVQATQSSTSVGGPRLNIDSQPFDEGAFDDSTSNPGGNGNILSQQLLLDQTVADYTANPNTIYVDTFQVDVEALGLEVRDLVDRDYGGLTGKAVWLAWQSPNIDVHSIHMRLVVKDETDPVTIADPLEDVAWPDTDQATPLQVSSLTWFDLGSKVTTPDDLVGATIQVNHRQATPYIADARVLRVFFVLELENVLVSGATESPKRLIADVAGLNGSKVTTFAAHVLTSSAILGQPTADVLDTASLNAVYALIPYLQRGVVTEQITAPELIAIMGDCGRVTFYWNAEGKLAARYRADRGSLGPPLYTYRGKHLTPTEGGPVRSRAPLGQLINAATVQALPNLLEPGSWGITLEAEDAASQAAYGGKVGFTLSAPFVFDATGAANLAAHVLDYNAALPERFTFSVHIEDVDTYAPGVGDVVGLDTPEVVADALVVERRVIVPGSGHEGTHALVVFTAVDRSP